ncbi:LacI family DNA-binding transcriptional regulator [Pontibacillus salicampi]|uniref:LacI family DNA-binding transcriptional regulator n=1 Tax=Pontibacillus salicampi TaxID=1449801 RepID=A0ABV6LQL0_9BACI
MKKITISDVAKQANVSRSTVSQYLNHRFDYMGEKTRDRIEQVIEELGYQPNIVARSLKQKSTKTIGVIVANILHNFSTEVSRAIEDVCHEVDIHTIICNADDEPKKEKKYIDMLRAKQVDGLIIFPTGGNKQLYQNMIDENYPVVFVDRKVDGIPVSSIMLDNHKSSKLAVDHCVEKGYDQIGIITTSIIRDVTPRLERLEGYERALNNRGIPIREEYKKSVEIESIQSTLHEMLQQDNPPQAVIAGNDLALIEILKYVKGHRLAMPEDLAVLGIDDVSFASFYSPPITTIAQPTFEMGEKAATVLLGKIQKQETKDEGIDIRFDPMLIPREST